MSRLMVLQRRARPTLAPEEAAVWPSKVGQKSAAAQAYSNARRAGRTHPGKVEKRKDGRKRHVTNRADLRAAGARRGATRSQSRAGWSKPVCACGNAQLRPFTNQCDRCLADQRAADLARLERLAQTDRRWNRRRVVR